MEGSLHEKIEPKVYFNRWVSPLEVSDFRKIFLVPFEQGYSFFDKPKHIQKSVVSLPLYYGSFNKLAIEKSPNHLNLKKPQVIPRYSRNEYIAVVNRLKQQIKQGNIYEINFCFDFFAHEVSIDPFQLFDNLTKLSNAPFSVLVKWGEYYILVASPERYLMKEGNRLIAQPMKGTRKLSGNRELDVAIVKDFKANLKEQNENVMIVDLVRNDLSRVAKRNTVKVDELFGVYEFNNVAQMISTVSCQLKEGLELKDILFNTFPMGSMTGAPKPKSLELINAIESVPRGFYSGALGFEDSKGDFDSCVIIRSIFYDGYNKTLSFNVGSAITDMCNAEEEYAECLIKAENMLKAVYGN